jgi:hypothetical protein
LLSRIEAVQRCQFFGAQDAERLEDSGPISFSAVAA